MSIRWRKLLGTAAVIAFLIAYSLFAMVLGGTLLVGCVYVLINSLSDVLYCTLDPRSREAAR